MIHRYSSRRQPLRTSFLEVRLQGAKQYDRIAGYFSSSLLEVAGEALASVSGSIRIVCNSELKAKDTETARAALQAQRLEWASTRPEQLVEAAPQKMGKRFALLYELLKSDKLCVRVLPRDKFGLLHGKAGVITLADDSRTSFLGSANATAMGWQGNYELLWEDSSPEAVAWVQEEFDALWNSPFTAPLAAFVVEDIGRIARRRVVMVEEWQEKPEPASVAVELPVFREAQGLWAHQKYFVKRAFEAHQGPHGARFLLADMVGLGKTVQLALSAQLMALQGDRPVLILAPKALLYQWQDEMKTLLDMPSAVWDSVKKQWVDENGIAHPTKGHEGILRCPRRVGLVSQGLITHGSESADYLLKQEYECVIVDEAHNARRSNLGPNSASKKPQPNNLLDFLLRIAFRTRSILLGTATPVQLYPVEAWDLLEVLSQGTEAVMGNMWSNWRLRVPQGLEIVMGKQQLPNGGHDLWSWIRNPLPPAGEDKDFALLRRSLDMKPEDVVATGSEWTTLRKPDKERVLRLRERFGQHHNPFIRHIVRRTRDFLENTINPEDNQPYMERIEVELFGEGPDESIPLPAYLESAYSHAEAFCQLLQERSNGSGFMETLLLRRIGSTMYAGRNTVEQILNEWQPVPEAAIEREEDTPFKSLTPEEEKELRACLTALEANQEQDPKYRQVVHYLLDKEWLERGCIIFSEYFDSIWWLAEQLSTRDLPEEPIGIYSAQDKSGLMRGGQFTPMDRDRLKEMVRRRKVRLILGTEAASEGLNLQQLSSLINLDLPWNPTRLEQRKGRIQRIGQREDTIYIYNMRYRGSVEERVHEMLSRRLAHIHSLFGQIPDTLEDVWIDVAFNKIEEAQRTIDAVPEQHPFELRYEQKSQVEPAGWDDCAEVLATEERRERLLRGWRG